MELLILIAFVGSLIYFNSRVSEVEKKIARLEAKQKETVPQNVSIPASVSSHTASRGVSSPVMPPAPSMFAPKSLQMQASPLQSAVPVSDPATSSSGFMNWLREDFLVKLGGFLLLLAIGWFVSYAFANGYIGPVGQITLGLVIGVGVLVFGTIRMQTDTSQGAIFSIIGSATIIMTIFAARGIYDFFTPGSALALMFLSVALVAFSSVRYRRVSMAQASLVLSAIAPLLTNAPEPDIISISLYLLLVVIGTLWVVKYLQAPQLPLLALIVVGLYHLPYISSSGAEDKFFGLLFAFIFTGIFFVANVLSTLSIREELHQPAHYLTALGTGVYLLSWILIAGPDAWQVPLLLLWMMVFTLGSFVVYTQTTNRTPFYLYGGVSIALLAAATAKLFSGAALTIMFAVELCVLVVLASSVLRNQVVARSLSALYIGLIGISFTHMSAFVNYDLFTATDAFALLVVVCSLFISGLFILQSKSKTEHHATEHTGGLLLVGAMVYVFIIIWLQLHALLSAGVAVTLALVIYTIVGLAIYIFGRQSDSDEIKKIGGLIIGGVVLRLLLVDVWNLAVTERIIVFFIVGLLLVSTAFIKKRR